MSISRSRTDRGVTKSESWTMATGDTVRWFTDIRLGDVATVGGKNASLGELYSALRNRASVCPTALP